MQSHESTEKDLRAGSGRAQRIAWFAAGAVASCASLMLLGPAIASPGPQETTVVRPVPMGASGMAADSNNRMIAVTGVDITGQSVLYVIDSVNPHLAVYQASGGASGTQNIKLVAARRIDGTRREHCAHLLLAIELRHPRGRSHAIVAHPLHRRLHRSSSVLHRCRHRGSDLAVVSKLRRPALPAWRRCSGSCGSSSLT